MQKERTGVFVVFISYLVAALVFTLFNTIPTNCLKQRIESACRKSVVDQAELIARIITTSGLPLSPSESVYDNFIDTDEGSRLLLTLEDGSIFYDSNTEDSLVSSLLLTKESISALHGVDSFAFDTYSSCFYSRASVPILSDSGSVVGAVCLIVADQSLYTEYDSSRSLIFMASFVCWVQPAIATVYYFAVYQRRKRALINGISSLKSGNFTQKLVYKPGDEFSGIAYELNGLTETFAATEEMRRRFVSDASHELKTPLASIKLLSDSIIQTPSMSYDEIRDFLIDISAEIDRLTRISGRLLTLTKLDDVNAVRKYTSLNLRPIAERVCRMLKPLAESTNCRLRPELSDCFILANYDTVYQIFFNLIENAIKYSGHDKEVRVFLYSRENKATFIVDDDGEGIPEEDLQKIFVRFYRVDKARARATGGTGLGLSIVASAVAALGGTVEASNRAGGGARFAARFPLSDAPSPEYLSQDDISSQSSSEKEGF